MKGLDLIMEKINVKKIKSSLTLKDYEKIMKALDIPAYSESNDNIVYWTGDKNKISLQGSPKLIFYKKNRIFVGYTASRTYDIISLVQTRLSILGQPCSFIDSIQFIIDIVGLSIENVKRISKPNVVDWQSGLEKFIRIRRGETILPDYDKKILDELNSDLLPIQWINEGISIHSMKKYRIGCYEVNGATTIPCFDKDGKLCGIRCRHWRQEEIEEGKYRPLLLADGTCYKFPTNEIFYGINYNWAAIEEYKKVLLVEGEKSVLQADSWFGEQSCVLGLYGSNLGLTRRNQLIKMGVKEVTIGLDSDFHVLDENDNEFKIFYNKIMRIAKMFSGYCKVYVMFNNIGLNAYKCSPFDFDKDTFDLMYKNRQSVYL